MAAAMREVEVAAGEIAARHGGKVLTIADARRRLAIAPWRGERWSCDRVSGVSFERRDGAARVVVVAAKRRQTLALRSKLMRST